MKTAAYIAAVSIAIVLFGAYSAVTVSTGDVESQFVDYITEFRKSYFSRDEYNTRLGLFTANLIKIEEMNANPNDEAVYGINHMSDWTEQEFNVLLGYKGGNDETVEERDFTPLATEVDWRGSLDMSAVKDQGSCGSCWAFAATEAIESAFAITHDHDLNFLSEQELVDCSGKYGNHGCSGGWHYSAFKYAKDNHGLNNEDDYVYQAKQAKCASVTAHFDDISGHYKVSKKQASLEGAIEVAPVAVAVDASKWSQYKSGVFSNCGTRVNHAVNAVGYTSNGEWIIRNSWGTRWGEKGFMYLKAGNTCGVLGYAYGVNA